MQVCNIQGNSFQGVFQQPKFEPNPVQREMITAIKAKFNTDKAIYKKGQNFINFLEKGDYHIMLSNGSRKNEIAVSIVAKVPETPETPEGYEFQKDCGSFSADKLDSVVSKAKKAWKDYTKDFIGFVMFGVAFVAFIISYIWNNQTVNKRNFGLAVLATTSSDSLDIFLIKIRNYPDNEGGNYKNYKNYEYYLSL